MSAGDLRARAAALRAQGLIYREIGAVLGVSRSYAAELVTDPAGTQVRRRQERARGRCADCGAPTSWGGARRCAPCWAAYRRATRPWPPEAILAALRAFAEREGRSPSAGDAGGGILATRAEGMPSYEAIRRMFGGMPAACRAAGLEPARRGYRARAGTR